MEGQPAKRRRVYSLEPNKVEQATFARNYMNYLVPALVKIKEKNSSEHNGHCDDIQNVVKYEVDMAMVYSAQGFAWSNALSLKLQRDRANVDSDETPSFGEEGSSRKTCGKNCEMVPLDHFSSNPSLKSSNNKCKDMPEMKRGLREENDDEDEVINGQLKNLRRLIPGGEEMCSDEQMVAELQSYISCLQMQVNILQCLSETH